MCKKAPGKSSRTGISVMELFNMFPNEKAARDWFENLLWPEGRFCPRCGSTKTSRVKNEKPMPYRCLDCMKHFSVKIGTVMESSKLPLQKWVFGIYLMSTSLKGVSSMKLHRDLGITQKTAWMMAQKIRQGWLEECGNMSGTVEADESYFGGKERNKHARHKLRAGRGPVGKTAVVGVKERGGKVSAKPIKNTDGKTLKGIIRDNVESGATVYTDQHKGYRGLHEYSHEAVNHGVGEYVRGKAHTNGIESFWAMLKRGYHGVYHYMSEKHLHRYVNEFAGRHNVRGLDTLAQMMFIAKGFHGKRLRYQDLVREYA